MINKMSFRVRVIGLSLMFLFAGLYAFAQVIPPKPNPPRLVNDMAHMMTAGEQDQLERELVDFSNETSNEITIVTIDSLGDNDVEDFAVKLGKAWGVGRSGKNNGVVVLASLKDHKINISPGKGLEGALTDLQCGEIIRNEMVPAFRDDKNYYEGFSKAAKAIIAATKGEYKADPKHHKGAQHVPLTAIIILVIIIFFIIKMFGRGGGGGGNYMSGGGLGNFATGMFLGSLLGGGRGGGGGFGGGGGDSDGGGFGGFGGGDFGGGGAGGSW